MQDWRKRREKKSFRNTERQYPNTPRGRDDVSSPSQRRTHEGRCCSCTGSRKRNHSGVWTRVLCAHRSEQATPLKDTITYSHTLKKLSTHLHKGQSLQQPHCLAHTNLWLRTPNKPATDTDSIHAIFRISRKPLCHLNYGSMSIKQNESLIRNGTCFLSSGRRSRINFHTNSIWKYTPLLSSTSPWALEPYLG